MSHLGPYPLDSIITGDARELARAIPDESVDLIFTDPVYDRIDDYHWLAETAARVLKPDSACLVWQGQSWLHDTLNAMCPPLTYTWQLHDNRIGNSNFAIRGRMVRKLDLCLWLEKGKAPLTRCFWDYHQSSDWPRFHALGWDKAPSTIIEWLDVFTTQNAIVFDPFTGGGTVPAVCKMLRRHYLAFEIDPDTAERARQRVLTTQAPLVFPEPEQLTMEV